MTSLDLTAGYWQVPLAANSRKYTALLFNRKNYQFKRLPFGLNTSVASFIKCLDEILQPKNLDFLTIYVDDILIASRTFEEHLEHIEYVLNKLYQGGVDSKLGKVEFFAERNTFLGGYHYTGRHTS